MSQAIEILAPAGSVETMRAALKAGADAVYMGGSRFGARAYADNPDETALLSAIDEVHIQGKKLYMTVNTLLKDREMDELYGYLLPYYREGLDGVIVQDLGVLDRLREWFPKLPLHASTQMTLTGWEEAVRLKKEGVWIYGAAMEGEDFRKVDFSGPAALVIGSEGEGLSRLVTENCDKLVSLPMKGKIGSLNASVAAGVLLYAMMGARA